MCSKAQSKHSKFWPNCGSYIFILFWTVFRKLLQLAVSPAKSAGLHWLATETIINSKKVADSVSTLPKILFVGRNM